MKVMIISGDPRIESYGGIEEHTNYLALYLSKIEEIKITIITYANKSQMIKENGIIFYRLKRLTNNKIIYLLLLPIDLYRILKMIQKNNPDIVHFQGVHPLYCFAAILCQNEYNTLLTVHGILEIETKFQAQTNVIFKYLSKTCERFSLSKIKHIIVVSPYVAEIIRKMTNSKTWVVPNGVDLDNIQKIKPLDLGKKNLIIFIGNFVKLKGIDILLKAFSIVKKQIPDAYLLIAGSGPQEKELKQLVKELSLDDNIIFLGFVKGDLKYSYIKSANFIIVPSRWDSLPIVVLEGMACRKPIIASNVGGIPYLVKDNENGFLVMADNINDLAEKIIKLLKNDELQMKMGSRGLERVQDFSWDKIALRTSEIYQEIYREK